MYLLLSLNLFVYIYSEYNDDTQISKVAHV